MNMLIITGVQWIDNVLGVLFLTHIFNAFIENKKLLRLNSISQKQIRLHSILIWALPFLWAFIFKDLLYTFDNKTMTKSKRKRLLKEQNSGFYESNKGLWG